MTSIEDLFYYQSTLVVIPSIEYNNVISQVPKLLSEKRICYITLNKTKNALVDFFNSENINSDNMVFIDSITKSIKQVENTKNCYFVSSSQALTELSLVITEVLQQKFDYLIFDSLTILMFYQRSEEPVIRFILNIVNKIKTTDCKGIFYILNTKKHEALIEQSFMVMDKILDSKYIIPQSIKNE